MNQITDTSLLDETHLEQLNHALEMAHHANRHLEQAQLAKIPVDELKKQNQANIDRIRELKQVYFPGR